MVEKGALEAGGEHPVLPIAMAGVEAADVIDEAEPLEIGPDNLKGGLLLQANSKVAPAIIPE